MHVGSRAPSLLRPRPGGCLSLRAPTWRRQGRPPPPAAGGRSTHLLGSRGDPPRPDAPRRWCAETGTLNSSRAWLPRIRRRLSVPRARSARGTAEWGRRAVRGYPRAGLDSGWARLTKDSRSPPSHPAPSPCLGQKPGFRSRLNAAPPSRGPGPSRVSCLCWWQIKMEAPRYGVWAGLGSTPRCCWPFPSTPSLFWANVLTGFCLTVIRVLANNSVGWSPSCRPQQGPPVGLAGWGLNYGVSLGPVCVRGFALARWPQKS